MEWLLIPGIILGIMVIWIVIIKLLQPCVVPVIVEVLTMFMVVVTVLTCITVPLAYLKQRGDVAALLNYYENIIQPNIVDVQNDYVVISNNNAAIWQAGDMNLSSYNSSITQRRYWISVPVIGSAVYSVPVELKFVRVAK